ncbi:MAG: translation elongation factor Ts [Kiritimatiellae bacterium]|nr:translation elongation factor Ts [Kiritimatiellia bacterium]
MAEITTSTIMDLRARTNAGMMDCKRALNETKGDMEAAIKLLRLQGLAIQVKRAGKEANQGIVQAAASADGACMALVEVNCETDFVAKTDGFKAFVAAVAAKVLAGDENVAETMKDDLVAIVSSTGENVKIRRVARFVRGGSGLVESYIHMGGKVGVLVEVGCGQAATAQKPVFTTLVHDVALQIAASAPRWLNSAEVPAEVVASEKDLYRKQVEGKPANVVEKILEGKIKKFYTEVCLVDQPFVKEPKTSITQVTAAVAKECGDTIAIKRFARFQLGAA